MRRKVSAAKALGPVVSVVVVGGLAACGGVTPHEPNLIAGKQAFVEKCGSCHKLNRAGTTGVSGPDLDQAFQQSLRDGMKRSTIEGVILKQIDIPNRRPQVDPETQKPTTGMPADLVKGDTARDVAAYVAQASANPRKETGRLAEIGQKKATASTKAENGRVEIPADPDGGLSYEFASATAEAGSLTLVSENPASIPHNIAIEGNGLDQKGPVVQDGGVSEISFDAEPGEYTFYCSVPGHRDGGMLGKLTVE